MLIIGIFLAAIVATSVMTLFSYAISESFRKLYKEPVLLGFILDAYHFQWSVKRRERAGWVLHYLTGLVFVALYFLPSQNGLGWYDTNLFTGTVFGAVCGIFGILGWTVLFRFDGRKPPVKLLGYFLQLFIAHLIFGVSAGLIGQWWAPHIICG